MGFLHAYALQLSPAKNGCKERGSDGQWHRGFPYGAIVLGYPKSPFAKHAPSVLLPSQPTRRLVPGATGAVDGTTSRPRRRCRALRGFLFVGRYERPATGGTVALELILGAAQNRADSQHLVSATDGHANFL